MVHDARCTETAKFWRQRLAILTGHTGFFALLKFFGENISTKEFHVNY
jgi:hypothetical protein